jgi:hypothetical protein
MASIGSIFLIFSLTLLLIRNGIVKLQELLEQALDSGRIMIQDREITRDDVLAVAAAKVLQSSPSVGVTVESIFHRDDNCGGPMDGELTTVHRVTVTASTAGDDWSGRRIEAVIPMLVSISPYGEIHIEPDRQRHDECALRQGDDEMPVFGSWLQRAVGHPLLREWMMS